MLLNHEIKACLQMRVFFITVILAENNSKLHHEMTLKDLFQTPPKKLKRNKEEGEGAQNALSPSPPPSSLLYGSSMQVNTEKTV